MKSPLDVQKIAKILGIRVGDAKDGVNTGDRTAVGLFIPLSAELAKQFPSLAPHDLSSPHTTFLYVGEVTKEREQEFLGICRDVFRDLRPVVKGWLGEMDYFIHPAYNRKVAHVAVHFNRDLALFRWLLRDALLEAGFDIQDSFPLVYRPHATLAYMDSLEDRLKMPPPQGAWEFNEIEVWGLPKVHGIPFGGAEVSASELVSRVALENLQAWSICAKYREKVEDEKGNTQYKYGPRQVAERGKRKAEKAEKLRTSISKLRKDVEKKLQDKDLNTRVVALAVALIDETYERVGNDSSAKDGHFGVTGWLKKHVNFKNGKAALKYTGKSGVKHSKEVSTPGIVKVLKDLSKGLKAEDPLLTCEGEDAGTFRCVRPAEVNEYLAKFEITAKDLRGFHANREMVERLRAFRKKGPDLPHPRKERDVILKEEFSKALEETATVVGHEASTLKSDYLVPNLVDSFMHDGTVVENFKQATKTYVEKEDEEFARLVRPSPKKKPPRKDKRRERVHVEDSDIDTGDRGEDPDLSLNYKRVGSQGEKTQSFAYRGAHISEPLRGSYPAISKLFRKKSTSKQDRREIMPQMTKKGALEVTREFDRLAAVMQKDFRALRLPKRIAMDMSFRLDLLSDTIEKLHGIARKEAAADFNPKEIAKKERGPLKQDGDEAYMKGEFTEQEFSELREKQEGGKLPKADKLASEEGIQEVTASLDRVAQLLQEEHEALEIPSRIAFDMAYKCDLVSDALQKKGDFDPREIGAPESGALEQDPDEPYMSDEFTEQEFSELQELQMAGKLAKEKEFSHGFKLFAAEEEEEEEEKETKEAFSHGFNLFA